MQPSDVTDDMCRAGLDVLERNGIEGLWGSRAYMREILAPALTAMPDDLLRKPVAERGCVMVPKEPTEAMLDALYQPWDMSDEDIRQRWARVLAASDPRQQALDRMAEDAREKGLTYDAPERKDSAPSPLAAARAVVEEQAEDEALWFEAETATEAYLQQALRELHAAIEEPKP